MQPITFQSKARPFSPSASEGVSFMVRQPTLLEQEDIAMELFRMNIVPMTEDSFRGNLIHEIFVVHQDNESFAEEQAALLEEYWTADRLHNDAMNMWQAQEDQRLLDLKAGVPEADLKQAPLPVFPMSRKRKSEASMFLDQLRESSARVRDLTIEKMNYGKAQRRGTSRILIEGWEGLKASCERDGSAVTEESYSAMVQEIGREALHELERHCEELSVLTERERGNLGSPPENESDQTGSQPQSGDLASSDGSSMGSSTGPTPSNTSEPTTDAPSGSISASDGNTSTPGGMSAADTSPNP